MAQRVDFDFTSEAFFRDPQAGVAQLRAIGPAVATKFPIIGRAWVTTTYEAAARVEGRRAVHAAQGGRRAGRAALVDAESDRNGRQQHVDDGRAGPHSAAQHRR